MEMVEKPRTGKGTSCHAPTDTIREKQGVGLPCDQELVSKEKDCQDCPYGNPLLLEPGARTRRGMDSGEMIIFIHLNRVL